LTPTSFDDLSDLRYTVSLPNQNGQDRYPFVHVAFSGAYGDRDDAVFIIAIMAAVQTAWFSPALIIDLTALSYTWGDEMEWVYGIGYDKDDRIRKQLVVVVGDQCSASLQSLDPDAYAEHCVDSLDAALAKLGNTRESG
jgi:hypothetical protein